MRIKLVMTVLCVALILLVLTPGAYAGTGKTITVGPGPGTDYKTIQAAIANASGGDTIYVQSGTYVENVVINRPINIIGVNTGAGLPVVDGQGKTAISIIVDGVTLQGFNATNAGTSAGIAVDSNYNTVTGNTANGNGMGIFIYKYSYNNVTGNTANNNINSGIYLLQSSRNNITGNIAENNSLRAGIFLDDSSANNIIGNTFDNNPYGIYIYDYSTYNKIALNNASNNQYYGMYVDPYSGSNIFIGNTANYNIDGVYLDCSSSNALTDNTIEHNSNDGIYLTKGAGNVFWLNAIDNNSANAVCFSPEMNYWNSTVMLPYTYNGYTFINYTGNYWGDYSGLDANGDGIGDTPYTVAANNIDDYPMTPTASATSGPVKNLRNGLTFTTIQEAIDDVNTVAGDTIQVSSGTYVEHLLVNKPILLKGVDTGDGMPLIPFNSDTSSVDIKADNVTFDGFNVSGDSWCGIDIEANNTTVSNNIVTGHVTMGVYGILTSGSNNTLYHNNVSYNNVGVRLANSNNSSLAGNTADGNSYGISLVGSNNNTLSGNDVQYNNEGVDLVNSAGNVFWLNTIGNNTILNAECNGLTNYWNSTVQRQYTYQGKSYTNYTGNYWGDYAGQDVNGDGIGDAPYTVAVSNIDYYPLLQSVPVAPATSEAQGWKFRSYLNNTGAYDDGGSHPGNSMLWNFTTGDGVDCSPTVANGVVYIGGWNGKVYALDAMTGAIKWNYTTGRCVDSSPAIVNGVVYVGSFDRSVYALSAGTGSKLWAYTTGDCVMSSPAVADGVVYVGSNDHSVYALSAGTGSKLWAYTTGGIVASSPAIVNGVVYVGSRDHNVYALDAGTGAKKWNFSTGGEVDSSPAVADGVVYVGSAFPDGKVYALDADTGAVKWSFMANNFNKSVVSSPAVANGIVYFGSDDRNVYALYANNGSVKWSYGTGDYVGSSPAVADGIVYIGSYDHNVYALDANTGVLQWSYRTMDAVYSSPAVANGVVYVGSEGLDTKVYAIGRPVSQPVVQPLIASLTMNVSQGTAPLSIRFTDLSSGGPTSWEWNFGDGSANVTSQNPSHTFTGLGYYTVTLTVRNSTTGAVSSVSRGVLVMDSFRLALKQGWNLVSFPVWNYSVKASSLNGTGVLIVSSYNRSTGDYDSYNTQVSPLKYDITMRTNVGYFVYCTRDTSIVINGQDPVNLSTTIYRGWNLVGWSSLNSSTAKSVVSEPSLTGSQIVARFNATTGDYDSYAEGTSPDSYDFAVQEGTGYFLYTNSAMQQTLYYGV